MPVETWTNQTNFPFILSGSVVNIDDAVLLQDAGRTLPLVSKTVMAQIAATGKWVPLTNIAATDGSARARGIFIGNDVTAAALVAGDVVGQSIYVGGALATLDGTQLVFENSLTLATVVETLTVNEHVIADDLASIGFYSESVIAIEEFENA